MTRLRLIPQPSPDSIDTLLLPVSAFPVPTQELEILQHFVLGLYDYLRSHAALESAVFIQVEHLHRAGNAQRFSSNAAHWLPMLGLGVWPDREPPHSWTREELEELEEGQPPRTLMPQLFQITTNGNSHRHAIETMLGTGTLLCAFAQSPASRVTAAAGDLFLPQIRDPEFRVFRYYFPLINSATLAAAALRADGARDWFCETNVYLRESPEDGGLLIASRESLTPAFEALGFRREEHHPGHWTIEA
ncbi:MAG TPA: hypothetical protein VKX25_19980 [Bryobacteraceae bacterium]|jgi:hypothetical protein|nr:hypothetical protein [Bryobacteraceae bacterium]